MHEFETISTIRKLFAKAPAQKNAPFTCDAELVTMADRLYGITVDEFSAEEDFFDDANPAALGYDLAVAAVSDLLAAGCEPCFYLQAIVAPYGRDNFATELSKGVKKVLDSCDCFLLGGDLGQSATWRYTGVAIGHCRNNTGLTRLLPPQPQKLWLTGALGAGNLKALKQPAPAFELRLNEARAMFDVANACIDTSGGLMEAVWMLKNVNPEFSFKIDSWALPYDAAVCRYACEHKLPLEAFAFGGGGEYELLFATDESVDLDWAANIGTAYPDSSGCVYWNERRLAQNPPNARGYKDVMAYIGALMEYLTCLN